MPLHLPCLLYVPLFIFRTVTPLHSLEFLHEVNWKVVSPDSTVGNLVSNIYITKIVVLVSEPVRGRSRATELPCSDLYPKDGVVWGGGGCIVIGCCLNFLLNIFYRGGGGGGGAK